MTPHIYHLLLLLLFNTIFFTGRSQSADCDLVKADFEKIRKGMSYETLCEMLEENGDLVKTDNSVNGETRYFNWYYACNGIKKHIQCWIRNNKVVLASRNFKASGCNGDLPERFALLKTGMTYTQVEELLGSPGDNYRNDYQYEYKDEDMQYYRWYSCSSPKKYLEVIFTNNKATSLNKFLN